MQKFQFALFDFDGTLVDSQWAWQTMLPRVLREKGIEVPEEEIEELLDVDWLSRHGEYCRRYGLPPLYTHHSEFFPYMDRFYREEVFFKPGAEEYLRELKRQGVTLAILSATPVPMIRHGLQRLGAEDLFDYVFSSREIGIPKSQPGSFEYCLNAMGATLKNTVLFEDALYSIATAKGMGMTVYAVSERCSRRNLKEIQRLADRYAVSMTEFLKE